MSYSQLMTAWNEYSNWQLQLEASPQICERCHGQGDHGFEEETGCLYICYACYGTGHHVSDSF